MKKLTALFALGLVSLTASESFAWFEICNTKSDGANMWVTYAYYVPYTDTIYTDACGSYEKLYSPSYFTTWRNTGWWYLTPNQCATVYGPALSNTWGYVYAYITDGSSLSGADVPFQVVSPAFTLDQYSTPVIQGSDPLQTNGYGYCANPVTPWTVNTLPVFQGSYSNFKLNIY
jgi:uncharacterized membrane protein